MAQRIRARATIGVALAAATLSATVGAVSAQTTSYTELNNLVVIYHHTNKGSLPADIISQLSISLAESSLFYWRNSHMSVLPRWTLYEVQDQVNFVQDNGYIYPWNVNTDLHNRGFTNNQYDAVYVLAIGSGNFAWGVYQCLGRGGFCQTGWWGTSSGGWTITHEYNHLVDSMFNSSGYPTYPHNHPGAARSAGEYVPDSGPDWDLNAEIFRYWPRASWLDLPNAGAWGTLRATADTDGDGVPDADATVPLDEARLGSIVGLVDSDGDGVSDLAEAMAGNFTSGDPMSNDSDGDGVLDAVDPAPIYPIATDVPQGTLSVSGTVAGWPLAGRYYYDHPADVARCGLYLGWDANFLYVGVSVGSTSAGRVRVHLDANADGLFHGPDNLEIVTNGSQVEQVILRDAAAATGDADYVESQLPTRNYFVRSYSETGVKHSLLRIPRDVSHGLDLVANERIGLRIVVDNYGRMFEPDDYLDVTLREPAPVRVDFDSDGDVDVSDFAFFQLAFNGPGRPPGLQPEGDAADADEDGDVDLADFSVFLACFNGPNRPPACS